MPLVKSAWTGPRPGDRSGDRGAGAVLRAGAAGEPRGMGETDPGSASGRRGSPFGTDVKEAFLAIELARPLLGQHRPERPGCSEKSQGRVGLRDGVAGRRKWQRPGRSCSTPRCSIARGLIKDVVLKHSLVSWGDIVKKGISRGQLGNVVPAAAGGVDLPEPRRPGCQRAAADSRDRRSTQ